MIKIGIWQDNAMDPYLRDLKKIQPAMNDLNLMLQSIGGNENVLAETAISLAAP
jgi:hypothetical protein